MAYFGSFDQGPIAASFAAANEGALSASVGQLPFLAPDLSTWSTNFELNAAVHQRCFYAFQMAASFSDPNIGIAFYTPPDQGLQIFDEEGNFITNVVGGEEQEGSGRRKRVARGPLRETVESCGCVGDPLPHYQAHNHVSPVTEVIYEYLPISAFLIAPTAVRATVTIEELRWTVPYPEGILPYLRELPSEYPLAYQLKRAAPTGSTEFATLSSSTLCAASTEQKHIPPFCAQSA